MTLDYTRTSGKDIDTLVAAIEAAAQRRNFRTLHIHDVQSTLAEKGFDLSPYRIVEVCNAGFAHRAITAHDAIGMMLPCRIVVYEVNGENSVMLLRPGILSQIMPDADLGSLPEELENLLVEVVDEAVA